MLDELLVRLADRAEILELHYAYAALLDTGRSDEVANAICTEDVVWDHGVGLDTARGHEGVTAFLVSMTSRYEGTLHALTNTRIEFDATGGARSQTYLQAYHWLRDNAEETSEDRPADFVTTGVYLDDLVRTSEGWRIAVRRRRNVGPSALGVGRLPEFMHGIGG